ncbi:TIGR02594 family protein [Roseivirga sp. BDSF3-8]|uniref:TIGR02594 family protein n=1 Tax=Roseivirga sp. BDSF3-8 TaxID=3241598 RepID=UPI00353218EC
MPEPEDIRANDYRWLKIAFGELDTAELSDPGENYRITQYLKSCEESLAFINENSDETAWCSAFMNWCVEMAGYAGTNSAWALNWRHWGQEAEARRGAIAVFKRFVFKNDQRYTFGHVGFYLGRDPDKDERVLILGGNQGNRVKVSSYPVKSRSYELLGFRRAPVANS